jgi:multifunctional methyltransferase subunit TRM112
MRLLTHNMLACNIKGVTKGYPLKIEAIKTEEKETDFNAAFLRHIYPKLDWKAFREAALSVSIVTTSVLGRLLLLEVWPE